MPEVESQVLDPAFLELLRCPKCRSRLLPSEGRLACIQVDCGLSYPIANGIPVLLVSEGRPIRPASGASNP